MFFVGGHFAERPVEAIGTEKRIVAEAFVAARRPDCDAVDSAFKFLEVTIWPGEAQRGHEMRATPVGSLGSLFNQQRLNAVHCGAKVLVWPGPPRGMNSRLTTKRIDDETGIVRECRHTAGACRRNSFDARVGGEGLPGFL